MAHRDQSTAARDQTGLSQAEVAERYGVTERIIGAWARSGAMPFAHRDKNRLQWDRAELEEWEETAFAQLLLKNLRSGMTLEPNPAASPNHNDDRNP